MKKKRQKDDENINRTIHLKKCPNCNHIGATKNGKRFLKNKYKQAYKCKKCNYQYTEYTRKTFKQLVALKKRKSKDEIK